MNNDIVAGGDIHAGTGYSESTKEKYAEAVESRIKSIETNIEFMKEEKMKYKRPTPEEAMAQMNADIAESKRIIDALMEYDLLDEDGYPTDEALQIIEEWHWSDPKGWFDFINSIWHMKSYGWSEGIEDHEFQKDKKVYRYNVSTIGWSGNESIIRSMQKTEMMWFLNWVQSHRGGHYIFELREPSE